MAIDFNEMAIDFDWTAAITQVLATVVIYKATEAVAEKLGLDDSAASIIGAVVGIYGGKVAGAMISPSKHESPKAGEGQSSLTPDDFASAGPTATDPAPEAPQPTQTPAAQPSNQAAGIMANATGGSRHNAAGGSGYGQPAAPVTPSIPQAPTYESQQAPAEVVIPGTDSTKIPAVKPEEDQSWWDKILSSERTWDTVVGAGVGAAKGYFAGKTVEDQRKAEYARDDAENQRLESGWANQNLNSVSQIGYPNQTPGPYKPPGMMTNARGY